VVASTNASGSRPRVTLRELSPPDYPSVLAMNSASESMLSPLDYARLAWIVAMQHRSLVAVADQTVVAFALTLPPATAYDSRNYEWFAANLEEFLYVDRVVVDSVARRQGIASLIYDQMETFAAPFRSIVCDVNVIPQNTGSLAFHSRRGYDEIGRLEHSGGHVAAMLRKGVGALQQDAPAVG
jgi:predicted GNAT superfamily acetyltransferase